MTKLIKGKNAKQVQCPKCGTNELILKKDLTTCPDCGAKRRVVQ